MQPNLFFFILGNQPSLSQAELLSFSALKIFLKSNEAVLISADEFLEPQAIIKKLGGAVKMGVILEILTKQNYQHNSTYSHNGIIKALINLIIQELTAPIEQNQKIYFGLSLYRLTNQAAANILLGDNQQSYLDQVAAIPLITLSQLTRLALKIKDSLKQKKIKCRWVASREINLSSVVVKTNKLLSKKGIEIILLIASDKIFIGKTLAVQEFAELEKRDCGRPARDAKSGMLPPKLAKIMINLGLADNYNNLKMRGSITILDPFCGSGTIISEALNMFTGAKPNLTLDRKIELARIIGVDISETAINQAQANINWLIATINLPVLNRSKLTFLISDVKNLSKNIAPQSVNLIITEPYLGPPMRGNESLNQLQRIQTELKILYLQAFAEFKKILQPKSNRTVIIFPIFKTKTGDKYLDILIDLKKIGFQLNKFSDISVNRRNGLEYGRPGQKIWREIFVFETSH